jgi:hypothetical protein
VIPLYIEAISTVKLGNVITNTSHQWFYTSEFVDFGGMANASFANVVDLALPIRIRFKGCLQSYVEYLETQVAHFGDGIDFDYLRTIVLTMSTSRIASMSMAPSALTHDAKCGDPSNCKTDDTR